MSLPVADLHCDLLVYLATDPRRTACDPAVRCSIPQLRDGGVAVQALAIYAAPGAGAVASGLAQARAFSRLVEDASSELERLHSSEQLRPGDGEPIRVIAAIENASAFCGETGRLQEGFDRLDEIERTVGRLLYVSLTWRAENRFGGGDGSRRGLSDDGRHLLERLAEKGIAVDFSHASPWLAADILDFLEARGLEPPVLASHSCFAALRDLPRNLPDEIAREIVRRRGLVGLNFLRPLLAPESPEGFVASARHALRLGGARSLAFGADFFAEVDVPAQMRLAAPEGYYLPGFEDASCYPRLLRLLAEEAEWPDGFLEDLAHRNAFDFLRRLLGD